MEPKPVVDLVLKDVQKEKVTLLHKGVTRHQVNQCVTTNIVLTRGHLLRISAEVCYFLLWYATSVNNLTLLVDFIPKLTHIFNWRATAEQDRLLVQACSVK